MYIESLPQGRVDFRLRYGGSRSWHIWNWKDTEVGGQARGCRWMRKKRTLRHFGQETGRCLRPPTPMNWRVDVCPAVNPHLRTFWTTLAGCRCSMPEKARPGMSRYCLLLRSSLTGPSNYLSIVRMACVGPPSRIPFINGISRCISKLRTPPAVQSLAAYHERLLDAHSIFRFRHLSLRNLHDTHCFRRCRIPS
jgi:hypothetical protein